MLLFSANKNVIIDFIYLLVNPASKIRQRNKQFTKKQQQNNAQQTRHMLLFRISRWAMLRSYVSVVRYEESDDVMTWWICWQSSLSRILSEDSSCCVFSRDFPESALQPRGGGLGLWPNRLWHWPKDLVRLMSMTGCGKCAFVWVSKALLWLRCRKWMSVVMFISLNMK